MLEKFWRTISLLSRKNRAPYKIPRIMKFVDELPKTKSGKIGSGTAVAGGGSKIKGFDIRIAILL